MAPYGTLRTRATRCEHGCGHGGQRRLLPLLVPSQATASRSMCIRDAANAEQAFDPLAVSPREGQRARRWHQLQHSCRALRDGILLVCS